MQVGCDTSAFNDNNDGQNIPISPTGDYSLSMSGAENSAYLLIIHIQLVTFDLDPSVAARLTPFDSKVLLIDSSQEYLRSIHWAWDYNLKPLGWGWCYLPSIYFRFYAYLIYLSAKADRQMHKSKTYRCHINPSSKINAPPSKHSEFQLESVKAKHRLINNYRNWY